MKVKVFAALMVSNLERKVNAFVSNANITVQQIQFQASFGEIYAMITYEDKQEKDNFDGFANI